MLHMEVDFNWPSNFLENVFGQCKSDTPLNIPYTTYNMLDKKWKSNYKRYVYYKLAMLSTASRL